MSQFTWTHTFCVIISILSLFVTYCYLLKREEGHAKSTLTWIERGFAVGATYGLLFLIYGKRLLNTSDMSTTPVSLQTPP